MFRFLRGGSTPGGYPPLHEMASTFQRELGVGGGSIDQTVTLACEVLGIDASNLTVVQKAQRCWDTIHGSNGTSASVPTAAPSGPPVSDEEDPDLAMALALSASMAELDMSAGSSSDLLDVSAGSSVLPSDGTGALPSAPPAFSKLPSFGLSTPRSMCQLLECPVCFDELCAEPCATFNRAGKRVCAHSLHLRCALELPSKNCPLCRADYDSVKTMPSLETDPDAWFDACDVEGDGCLSKDETQLVFLTQFPLDAKTFEDAFNDVWPTLQLDGTGRINKEQFFASGGLLELAQQKLLRHGAAGSGDRPGDGAADASSIGGSTSGGGGGGCGGGGAAAGPPIPDIMTERDAWFSRFDEDGAGLTQEEVVRGLIKTYRLGSDLEQVRSMRALVAEVWGIFAPSGPNARINRERFNLPHDGLADAIIANLDLSALPQQLSEDRALAAALAAENSSADTSAAPPPRDGAPSGEPPSALPQLPDNIKACPACGILMEKISGDDTMMCGCEARPAGGTFEKAWAAGGCGHEFNFRTLAPLGVGKPGEPHNARQVYFRR